MQGLQLPRSRQILLTEDQGLQDVGLMAVDQQLLYAGVKVLVILTGFAEVEAQHPALLNSVRAAIDRICGNVHYRKIVLGAPLPRPGASVLQLRELFKLSKLIQWCCKDSDRLEFTKSGFLFYGPGGLYANQMKETGLTSVGLNNLRNQLLDKLNSLGVLGKLAGLAASSGSQVS